MTGASYRFDPSISRSRIGGRPGADPSSRGTMCQPSSPFSSSIGSIKKIAPDPPGARTSSRLTRPAVSGTWIRPLAGVRTNGVGSGLGRVRYSTSGESSTGLTGMLRRSSGETLASAPTSGAPARLSSISTGSLGFAEVQPPRPTAASDVTINQLASFPTGVTRRRGRSHRAKDQRGPIADDSHRPIATGGCPGLPRAGAPVAV